MAPITDADHADGPADAPVTLVEYGDYQCPDCGAAEPILRTVRERMGDRLRFVFRNFPLMDVHPFALGAAVASEAAAAQGAFWPMHDLLLQNQEALDKEDLLEYAGRLGLDLDKFREALDSRALEDQVRKEAKEGEKDGVSATPTLFLNGQAYDGPMDADAIIAASGA